MDIIDLKYDTKEDEFEYRGYRISIDNAGEIMIFKGKLIYKTHPYYCFGMAIDLIDKMIDTDFIAEVY
jgi:hypothetical protein